MTAKITKRAVGKISKSAVDKLKAKAAPYTFWDIEVKGFGVRVMPTGSKTYVVYYRQGAKQRLLKLDRHGVLTAEQARKDAKNHLSDISKGADPSGKNTEKQQNRTISVAKLQI